MQRSNSLSPLSEEDQRIRIRIEAPCEERQSVGNPHLRILGIAIFVRDQDRSLDFYVNRLGFDLLSDATLGSGFRWIAVGPPDGTAFLVLASSPGTSGERTIGGPTGVLFVTDDADAKYREWLGRGVHFHSPPKSELWGGSGAVFEDVDGNSFVLVESDIATRQIEAERRAVELRREAERRAAHELEIARQVQARLFPQRFPTLDTLDYAGVCLQARQVGGDYYDILDLGHGRLGLVIGDVAGKGIGAALLMANLQANLRSQYVAAQDDVASLLASVNRLFYENTPEASYATLFFGTYDDATRQLRYVNCGHFAPLLLKGDGTVIRLESTCPVLGIFAHLHCQAGETQLSPGDLLVLYTDGVTEAMDAAETEFGEQRLADAARANAHLPAQELLQEVVGAVTQFSGQRQRDDITLLVARCRG